MYSKQTLQSTFTNINNINHHWNLRNKSYHSKETARILRSFIPRVYSIRKSHPSFDSGIVRRYLDSNTNSILGYTLFDTVFVKMTKSSMSTQSPWNDCTLSTRQTFQTLLTMLSIVTTVSGSAIPGYYDGIQADSDLTQRSQSTNGGSTHLTDGSSPHLSQDSVVWNGTDIEGKGRTIDTGTLPRHIGENELTERSQTRTHSSSNHLIINSINKEASLSNGTNIGLNNIETGISLNNIKKDQKPDGKSEGYSAESKTPGEETQQIDLVNSLLIQKIKRGIIDTNITNTEVLTSMLNNTGLNKSNLTTVLNKNSSNDSVSIQKKKEFLDEWSLGGHMYVIIMLSGLVCVAILFMLCSLFHKAEAFNVKNSANNEGGLLYDKSGHLTTYDGHTAVPLL